MYHTLLHKRQNTQTVKHYYVKQKFGQLEHFKVYRCRVSFPVVSLCSLGVRRSAPAGPLSGVQPEVGVEVCRLVEALPADVAAEGLFPRVDSVVPLQHADRGEALPAHRTAVRLLLGVPAHVDLQLAGEAEALPALFTAVPPLDALARVRGARQWRLQGSHVLDLQ